MRTDNTFPKFRQKKGIYNYKKPQEHRPALEVFCWDWTALRKLKKAENGYQRMDIT